MERRKNYRSKDRRLQKIDEPSSKIDRTLIVKEGYDAQTIFSLGPILCL